MFDSKSGMRTGLFLVQPLCCIMLLVSGAGLSGKTVLYLRFESGNSAGIPVNPIPLTGESNTHSLQFTTPSDAVIIDSPFPFNHNGPGDATVEFWLKVPTPQHSAVLWGLPNSDGVNRFHFYVNPDNTVGLDYFTPSGDLQVIFGIGQPFGGVPVPPGLGVWNHFAITRLGNEYNLYINGHQSANKSAPSTDLPTGTHWSISGRPCCAFTGFMDELRVSNVALAPYQFLNAPVRDFVPPAPAPAGMLQAFASNALGNRDRNVVFDAMTSFTIQSAGVRIDPLTTGPSTIAVSVWEVALGGSANLGLGTRGAVPLAVSTGTIGDKDLDFYDVPISFTFQQGIVTVLASTGLLHPLAGATQPIWSSIISASARRTIRPSVTTSRLSWGVS